MTTFCRRPNVSARLLYVVNDAPSFVSRRLAIAVAARREGYDVHIAAPRVETSPGGVPDHSFYDFPPDRAIEHLTAAGFIVHRLSLTRRGMSPVDEAAAAYELLHLYGSIRPEIVHHFTIKPILYGTFAARLSGVPFVVNSFVGLGYLFSNGRFARVRRAAIVRAYGALCRRAGIESVFQNPDDAALFIRANPALSAHIHLIQGGSGVDLTSFHPKPEPTGVPVVLLAGRMLWDKGIGEFVEAASLVKAAGIAARFVLVGGMDERNPKAISRAQMDTWTRSGAIEWLGQRDDMADLLAAAHLICLPSYREGVPRVLLEAAASGRAIVATDVPGCREVVRHGHNGLLVPVSDPRALAHAITTLLRDPATRQRMGHEGSAMARDQFGLDHVVRQTLALYEQLPSVKPFPVPNPTGA